jgi:hypothetical protein
MERLKEAIEQLEAAETAKGKAQDSIVEARLKIAECHKEIRTGVPSAPLLDAIERKAAPPGPRPPADYSGRRGMPPALTSADREPVRPSKSR